MSTNKKLTYTLAAFIAAVILIISSLVGGGLGVTYAATSATPQTAYEAQNVLTDLTGSTIAGKPFDLADYPADENGEIGIVSFNEYCYSDYEDKADNFALYVYVYNPRLLTIDTVTDRNEINIKCGNQSTWYSYSLVFLNYSTTAESEKLFYKFKVDLSDSQRSTILNVLDVKSRVYDISGIKISVNKDVINYPCGQKYTYSGYATGCGSSLTESESLDCNVENYETYLNPSVYHTVYRPKGDYYDGEQAQLNSCFFRIPKNCFTDYGELTEVVCEWEEYVTKPMLVTEDKDIFVDLSSLYGGALSQKTKTDYLFESIGNSTYSRWPTYINMFAPGYNNGDTLVWLSTENMESKYSWGRYDGKWYNPFSWTAWSYLTNEFPSEHRFDNFAAVFYTGGESYKTYGPSAEEVRERLLANSEVLGAPYYTDRFSQSLFLDVVQEGHTKGKNRVLISSDNTFDIYSTMTTQNWWQQHISGGFDVDKEWTTLSAFYTVKKTDVQGTSAEVAARLFIAEADVQKLKSEVAAAGDTENVVICRYSTNTYQSMPMAQVKKAGDTGRKTLAKAAYDQVNDKSYTAYCAMETVFLDFEFIHFKFKRGNVETIIPAVTTPTDAIGGLTPPLEENYHTEGNDRITKLIALILGLLLIVIIIGVLSPIISPWFGTVSRAIKNSFHKKE